MPDRSPTTLSGTPRFVEYDRIDAAEIDDGALRLYRRRGLFGLLRRQDIFHPAGEWLTFKLHPSGKCQVTVAWRDLVERVL
jgi:hypothetical protein